MKVMIMNKISRINNDFIYLFNKIDSRNGDYVCQNVGL